MLTSFLLLPLFASPQAAALPAPHPSYVVDVDPERWNSSSGGSETAARWVALRPSWLDEDRPRLLAEDARAGVSRFVAEKNHWSEHARLSWLQTTARRPVRLHYRLSQADGKTLLLAGTESVWPGEPAVFADTTDRTVVRDFDVEIAQAASIADPIPGIQVAGISLGVEILPVPGLGWQVELALVVSRFGDAEPIEMRYYAIRGMDRLVQHFQESGATLFLKPGETIRLELPAPDGSSDFLDLSLEGSLPQTVAAGDGVITIAAPTLTVRPDWPDILASLGSKDQFWATREGYLAFSGPAAATQAEKVQAEAQQRARRLHYELTLTSQSRTSGTEPQTLARVAGTAVGETPLRFARGTLSQALVSWDVEVAQGSRIADPEFHTFLSGVKGEIEGVLSQDGQPGAVRIDLEVSKVRHGNSVLLQLSGETPGILANGQPRTSSQQADVVSVERPEVTTMRIQGRFVPDSDGRIVVEREGLQLSGGLGKVRMELRVTAVD